MVVPLTLFFATFLLYLVTLTGTIPAYRDSGDMINAVTTLGIAHPPGYPAYVLIGKLFSELLPWANPAYRVNVFSALAAAGSTLLLFMTLHLMVPGTMLKRGANLCLAPASNVVIGWDRLKLNCIVGAIWYALTPANISLARVSEMYALASLFGTLIIACALAGTPRSLLLGSFLLGLGFGVHPTLLFLGPLLLTFRRGAFTRLAFFLIGFSVVLFLMIRSSEGPLQNWGNPATWTDLWKMLTRSNYGGLKLHPEQSQFAWTASGLLAQGVYFLKTLLGQWGWAGLLAGGFGLVAGWRGPYRKFNGRLAASGLLAGPLFFALSNLPLEQHTTTPILEPYLVLVNVIWAVWVAQGLYLAIEQVRVPAAHGLIGVIALLIPMIRLQDSFQSYRWHFHAYDLGRNIMRTSPPRAVLFDPDDPIAFSMRSLQLLESRRDDIVLLNFFRTYWGYRQILDRWKDLLPLGPIYNAPELERALWRYSIKKRPFYADLPVKVPAGMGYRMEGLLYRIEPSPRPPTSEELQQTERWFALYPWRGQWRSTQHPDFFTRQILNYVSAAYCNLGLRYAARQDWDRARWWYRRALGVDPQLSPAYNNLGVADFEQGRFTQAVEHYRMALRYDPTHLGYKRNLDLALNKVGS